MLVIVRRPSPRPTIVSDPAGACKIDARTVLNVGDTPLLTSTSSPALPRFDTDVRAPPFNVPECALHPSRRPSSSPVTPPPSSPSTPAISTPSATLPTSLTSTLSTPSSLSWTSSRRRSLNPGGNPLDNVADAFNVALLNVPDAALIDTLALHDASWVANPLSVGDDEIARRRRDSTSETTASQDVVDDLDECSPSPSSAVWAMSADISCTDRSPRVRTCLARVQMRPARATRASSSRAGRLLIDCIEESHRPSRRSRRRAKGEERR
ncbi:hypothetical protein EV715DRAFT_298204 [Schizophyllum commune]